MAVYFCQWHALISLVAWVVALLPWNWTMSIESLKEKSGIKNPPYPCHEWQTYNLLPKRFLMGDPSVSILFHAEEGEK